MKLIQLLACTTLLTPLALLAGDNQLSEARKADGWIALFDGESLNGWSVKSGFATYAVEDGAIVGTTAKGSPNTFLCSDQTFADFVLVFEVKLDNNELNSGVQIRSKLRGDDYGGRVYGPQVEIEYTPGQAGFIYGEAAGGWQSPMIVEKGEDACAHEYFQNGKWNQYKVRVMGRRIQTWLNGIMIEDMKYDPKLYEDNPAGFIGLQVHQISEDAGPYSVRWKNIYIKQLEKKDKE